MDGLKGKSVIVTGGGSGIGRATALMLAAAGCKVTIADLTGTGVQDTAIATHALAAFSDEA